MGVVQWVWSSGCGPVGVVRWVWSGGRKRAVEPRVLYKLHGELNSQGSFRSETDHHCVRRRRHVLLDGAGQSLCCFQAYIHQHAWLVFSSLALSMAHLIYNSAVRWHDNNAVDNAVDSDYTKASTQLHNQCLTLAISCLMKVNMADDAAAEVDAEEYKQRMREEAFAVHSQERIMGLLAAMIPPVDKPAATDVSFKFSSKKFLNLLLNIARGEGGHESNTQHLAMGLLGQLLHGPALSCAVTDAAIKLGDVTPALETGKSDTEGEFSADETLEEGGDAAGAAGEATARFLFSFGAACLERSGLEWAHSLVSILQTLLTCPRWKDVLLRCLSRSIQGLRVICAADADHDDVSGVFAQLTQDGAEYVTKDAALDYARRRGVERGVSEPADARLEEMWSKHDTERTGRLARDAFVKFAKEVNGCPESELPLASIFALFVVAGFPEVLSIGCQVSDRVRTTISERHTMVV